MSHPTGTVLTGQEILNRQLAMSPTVEIQWTRDTTLVADNWRVLHSRPGIAGADTGRVLLRKLVT